MDYSQATRDLCKQQNVSLSELAGLTGQSPQNLSNRIRKGNIRFDEYIEYAKALGGEFEYTLSMPGESKALASSSQDAASSEIALLEAQVEVERRFNEYLVDVTKNIRTPLSTILMAAELAEKHLGDDDKFKKDIRKIRTAGSKISALIDEIIVRKSGESPKDDDTDERSEVVSEEALKGKKILLAEDNDLNREVVRDMLLERGLLVDTAEDGETAVKLVSENEPGCYCAILMDVVMPVMDGLEATKKIRGLSNRIRANVPIIAMTANVFDKDKVKAKKFGMDGYLTKPVDADKMIQTIAKYI